MFLFKILSSIYVIRGKVLEGLDNRGLAAEAFKDALKVDVSCSEAFYAITQHQILTAVEEKALLKSLEFGKLTGNEGELVEFLYKMRLKKYDKPADLMIPNKYKDLAMSLDLLVYQAERHYYNCDYAECFRLSQM